MNDEYERPIVVDPNIIPKMSIDGAPMGEGRDDRSVFIDDTREEKRTSNIMLGYNKEGIELENGVVISWEEFREAVRTQTESIGENEYIECIPTGKKVTSEEMIDELYTRAIEEHSSIVLKSGSGIPNQETRTVNVREAGKNSPEIGKGVLMLGKDKVQLPSGEYLSLEELQTALNNYTIKGKFENEKHDVLYRKKSNKIPPIVLSALFTIVMILSMFDIEITDEKFVSYYNELLYKIGYSQEVEKDLTEEEVIYLIAEDIKTGDKIQVPSGLTYWESSDHDYGGRDNSGVFLDKRIREPGEYTAQYFSVLYKGKIQNVQYAPGVELKEIIEKESQRLNCSPTELRVMLHIGNKVSGWVDFDDLIKGYEKEGFIPTVYTEKKQSLEGKTEFNPTIKIDNGTGNEVEIRVVDEDGNLLEPGSIVIGTDGLEYEIESLNIETQETVGGAEQKKQVSFSIKNIDAYEALALAAILAAIAITAKKRKEFTETPMTDKEIENLVENARLAFEQSSEVQEAINNANERKRRKTPTPYDTDIEEQIKRGKVELRTFMEENGFEDVPETAKDFEGAYRASVTANPNESIGGGIRR